MKDSLFIVLPAYNESANIEKTIDEWHGVVARINSDSRLVIFDDGSKDQTFEIMKKLSDRYPQFIPETKSNSGHGATCMHAYQYALNAGAEYIFQTDSDGQTSPEEFWSFWEQRNNYDFIIGQRKNREDGHSRKVVSFVLRLLVFAIFKVNVRDANTPFRLMNSTKLRPIIEIIPSDFFLSNVMISMLVVKRNENRIWLPITFKPRQAGNNSINLKRIFSIGLKAIPDFYKIKQKIK